MKKNNSLIYGLLVVICCIIAANCASSIPTMMIKEKSVIKPDASSAVINFIFPTIASSTPTAPAKLSVWDSENFIGILSAGYYIPYKTKPGEHIFLVRAENWAVVKANLEAGKTYYIKYSTEKGRYVRPRVLMEIVKPDNSNLDSWLTTLMPISVDQVQKAAFEKSRLASMKNVLQNIDWGTIDFMTMNISDGK